MVLRRLTFLLLLSFLIPFCIAGAVQKKKKSMSSTTVTPRIENTDFGKVKIYQKKRGKASVDIRIPIGYQDFEEFAKHFVGRDFEIDDNPVPTIPQSIKMFFRSVGTGGDGTGISVSPFTVSDQYIQLRLSRFENGGNSGHLENEFKIIDRQTKKLLFIYDIIESESDWKFKSQKLVDAVNSEIKILRKQIDGLETIKDTDVLQSTPFWLDRDGIYFWFGRCGIAPCAYGAIVIKVPYNKIKDIVKPEIYKNAAAQTNFKQLPIIKFTDCWDDEVFTPLN